MIPNNKIEIGDMVEDLTDGQRGVIVKKRYDDNRLYFSRSKRKCERYTGWAYVLEANLGKGTGGSDIWCEEPTLRRLYGPGDLIDQDVEMSLICRV